MASDPFCRESGAGPGVVCLHSNASSSSQWRALMERLAQRHRVLAPDTHGAGKGQAWPEDCPLAMADEVSLLEPVFARAGAPFSLVGHSYGLCSRWLMMTSDLDCQREQPCAVLSTGPPTEIGRAHV